MSVQLKIEWLNRYVNNRGKKGSVQGSFHYPLRYIRVNSMWYGFSILTTVKPADVSPNTVIDPYITFAEPAVMTAPPHEERGEYDQRLTIYDSETGEEFYKAEMLKENYAPGSHEPFELLGKIRFNIERCRTDIPVVENL